jgi:IPT/TIG domain/WD40-like Beta Propeller Repeat
MCLRRVAPTVLAAILFVLVGCGAPAPNPTPQITALFPSEITASSRAFTLFVSGTQFESNSVVQWNGSNRPTTYNEATTEVAASITAADVQTAGVALVTVTTPAPGGGTSVAATFTINPLTTGAPTITSLSPNSAALNSPGFTLTVKGTNFLPTDYVTWEGGLRATTYTSATQLTAQVLSTDLTQQMVASVAVHTSQLGVASPSVGFQVGAAQRDSVKFPQVISVSAAGRTANGASSSPAVSANGRYVAFYSEAKNLVAFGASGNIFVRDTCVGAATSNCTPRTVAVDLAPDGSAPNDIATSPDISADGRYIAFASRATDLVSSTLLDQHAWRSFLRDSCVGHAIPANCSSHTEVVSVNNAGDEVTGGDPVLSADGRFVVFTSSGAGLVPEKQGFAALVFVRDTCHGPTATTGCTPQTQLASVSEGGQILIDPREKPSISQSGRYIAFAGAPASGWRAKRVATSQIFLRDTCWGVSSNQDCQPSTVLVSASADGERGNADSASPSVSADGRFVVFESAASNLTFDSAKRQDVYLRDTCLGPTAPFDCLPSTIRISDSAALPGEFVQNYSPAISPSGRYISYAEQNSRDSYGDRSGSGGLIVYDTCLGAITSCSPGELALSAPDGSPIAVNFGNNGYPRVPLTPDARFIAFFTSQAVASTTTSGLGDVFLTTSPFEPEP